MYKKPEIEWIDIDLRDEFSSMNDMFGLNILLVRKNKNSRCKCWSELNLDGDPKCKLCGGTGKVSSIEQVKAINETVSSSNTSAILKMTELGLSIANTMVMYFDYKVAPKVQDRIFIVGFDKFGLPIDIKKSCTIVSIEPVRGDRGRLELYKAFVKYSPEKIKTDQMRLNAIPPEAKAKLVKGVRYTWPQDQM